MGDRVAVFGDVGGHVDLLSESIARLGGDPDSGVLPDGLCVISVGDLLGPGPDSDGVVRMVERFRQNGAAWVQLIGNHEAAWLGGDGLFGTSTHETTVSLLRRWADDGWLRLACGITTPWGDYLITHAGLTHGTWEELGCPVTAASAANLLNRLVGEQPEQAFRPGRMLAGETRSFRAGVCWAEATSELIASWVGHQMPFSQIHGHSSPYRWNQDRWSDPHLIASVDGWGINHRARRTVVSIGDHNLVGVDPGLSPYSVRPLVPFVLCGVLR